MWFGLGIVAVLFLVNVVASSVLHQYFFILNRVGMRIKSATIAMIFNKALRTNLANNNESDSKAKEKADDDKKACAVADANACLISRPFLIFF